MRIIKEKTAAFVIDIQERLFPVMYKKENLLKNCEILIEALVELSVPLIVTQQYTKGLGETIPEIRSHIPNFNYTEKHDFSCCGELSIIERLKKTGIENVIICGIESHVCVLQTAVDLKETGMNPVVVTDCISSRTEDNIVAAKERFRYENIMMTSYESIIFELTRSSTAPVFRTVSRLIK
ncbi:MAG: isochorismatase family protein [Bacteroidales bacterium]|jgi:nicotinamidase-related amidase|nr:isochorismatase family protein [Bacteroidales bacterium]